MLEAESAFFRRDAFNLGSAQGDEFSKAAMAELALYAVRPDGVVILDSLEEAGV